VALLARIRYITFNPIRFCSLQPTPTKHQNPIKVTQKSKLNLPKWHKFLWITKICVPSKGSRTSCPCRRKTNDFLFFLSQANQIRSIYGWVHTFCRKRKARGPRNVTNPFLIYFSFFFGVYSLVLVALGGVPPLFMHFGVFDAWFWRFLGRLSELTKCFKYWMLGFDMLWYFWLVEGFELCWLGL
jgi:hypothetical protein